LFFVVVIVMVRYFLAFALHRVFRLSFSDGSHLFGLTQQDTAFACRVISGINMQSASIVFARFSVVCMACTSFFVTSWGRLRGQ
jgi:hypothetical protein